MTIVDINFPYEKILERKKRYETAYAMQKADRVPVLHYIGSRYWIDFIEGCSIGDYLKDAKTMLECQLRGQKWILENVDSDFFETVCYPDFMWVEDIHSFGAECVFPENDSPWVVRPYMLEKDADLEQLRKVDYVYNGLHGKMIDFYKQMKDLGAEYRVRFSDGEVIQVTDLVYMGNGGIIGPTTIAGDLRGVENFSIDLFDRPEWVHELYNIIVDKSIEWLDAVYDIGKDKVAFCSHYYPNTIFIGDDGTAQMSPQQVEEFALKPLQELADHFRNKGFDIMMHNCGKADHLLQLWADEVKIDRYIGFSYQMDKNKLKEIMGNRIFLMGGVNTVILRERTLEDVMEDVRKNLEVFKDLDGFVLMDGHNVAPGTPVQNLNAVTEAVRKYDAF